MSIDFDKTSKLCVNGKICKLTEGNEYFYHLYWACRENGHKYDNDAQNIGYISHKCTVITNKVVKTVSSKNGR